MSEVNQHYLDHVVKLSETAEIEASEDILAGNGMKLLAKGTRVDARARERLLEFRLTKPLENMLRVVGGTEATDFHATAEALLAKHALLRGICSTATGFRPATALRETAVSSSVLSMLSVYAGQAPGKLDHAVGVALLSAALGGDLSVNPAHTSALVVAGLTHDVGELYIDPAFLIKGTHLTPQQWKHVATHPIVGSHVLGAMPGAGPRVAGVVLAHHERLDGFGYPQGTLGESLSGAGQILAVSEMLMGLMETGSNHAERASVAMRLVPGEFARRLVDRVASGAKLAMGGPVASQPLTIDIADLAARTAALSTSLGHVRRLQDQIELELSKLSSGLRALIAQAFMRWERIRLAFVSTGLDGSCDAKALGTLIESMAPSELIEVDIVLRELRWRLSELERQLFVRSELFAPRETQWMLHLLDRAKTPPVVA